METKDNNVAEKVDNLCDNLGIEEQPKDPRGNLEAIENDIGPIPDPNLDDDPLEKPSIAFKPSNLGMKIPENAFYIVMKSGIYIYLKDPQEVRIFQKIYEKYPAIWEDQGIIDMLEKHMMKIPLIK